MLRLLVVLALLTLSVAARAQDALVVQTCGTLPLAYSAGSTRLLTVDVNGKMCSSVGAVTLVVGSTAITGGTSGRVLYDNAGVLGEYPITGTGSAVLSTSPTIASPTITGAFTATGLVTNADLVSASTTVNGVACTLGSSCTISASAAALIVGTTTVTSGTTARVLFDNGGVLGEYAITGSGNVAMSASPIFTGTLTAATLVATGTIATIGSTANAETTLTLSNTTGNGGTQLLATANNYYMYVGSSNINYFQAFGSDGHILLTQDIPATSTVTGALQLSGATGGLGMKGALWVGGLANIAGAVTHQSTTTLSGALTYGGVTLTNNVTGTGKMVLSDSPTFTTALTAAAPTFTGTLTAATVTASGIISTTSATDSTTGSTGSIHTSGGLGVAKQLSIGLTSTTDAQLNFVNSSLAAGQTYIDFSGTTGFFQHNGKAYLTVSSAGAFTFGQYSTGNLGFGVLSTDSGGAVIAGGAATAASLILTNNAAGLTIGSAATAGDTLITFKNTATTTTQIDASGANLYLYVNGLTGVTYFGADGHAIMPANVASTSTTTGTLVVTGGFGLTGSIFMGGQLNVAAMTQTSAAQSGTVCYNSGTGAVTYDATLGCLTSSLRYKDGFTQIGAKDALREVIRMADYVGGYTYKPGYGLPHGEQIGYAAERLAEIDERLVERDTTGAVRGARYQQGSALFAPAIKELSRQVEELRQKVMP